MSGHEPLRTFSCHSSPLEVDIFDYSFDAVSGFVPSFLRFPFDFIFEYTFSGGALVHASDLIGLIVIAEKLTFPEVPVYVYVCT